MPGIWELIQQVNRDKQAKEQFDARRQDNINQFNAQLQQAKELQQIAQQNRIADEVRGFTNTGTALQDLASLSPDTVEMGRTIANSLGMTGLDDFQHDNLAQQVMLMRPDEVGQMLQNFGAKTPVTGFGGLGDLQETSRLNQVLAQAQAQRNLQDVDANAALAIDAKKADLARQQAIIRGADAETYRSLNMAPQGVMLSKDFGDKMRGGYTFTPANQGHYVPPYMDPKTMQMNPGGFIGATPARFSQVSTPKTAEELRAESDYMNKGGDNALPLMLDPTKLPPPTAAVEQPVGAKPSAVEAPAGAVIPKAASSIWEGIKSAASKMGGPNYASAYSQAAEIMSKGPSFKEQLFTGYDPAKYAEKPEAAVQTPNPSQQILSKDTPIESDVLDMFVPFNDPMSNDLTQLQAPEGGFNVGKMLSAFGGGDEKGTTAKRIEEDTFNIAGGGRGTKATSAPVVDQSAAIGELQSLLKSMTAPKTNSLRDISTGQRDAENLETLRVTKPETYRKIMEMRALRQ